MERYLYKNATGLVQEYPHSRLGLVDIQNRVQIAPAGMAFSIHLSAAGLQARR
jgi:hypothetical protein